MAAIEIIAISAQLYCAIFTGVCSVGLLLGKLKWVKNTKLPSLRANAKDQEWEDKKEVFRGEVTRLAHEISKNWAKHPMVK